MSFGEANRGPHSWTLDEEKSRVLMRQAIEGGINFFDTANGYSSGSSEEITGRALRDFARRDEVVYPPTRAQGRRRRLTRAAPDRRGATPGRFLPDVE